MSSAIIDRNLNSNSNLFGLAQQLALNYYHVSISKRNPESNKSNDHEDYENQKYIISKVFRDDQGTDRIENYKKIYRYGRNVLIIGAGASKNAYDKLLITEQIIDELFYKLKFYDFLAGRGVERKDVTILKGQTIKQIIDSQSYNHIQVEKFFHYIENLFLEEIDENMSLNLFISQLGFEKCLKILQYITQDDDISYGIQEVLGGYLRYIPNEFYEIAAYLFKHRFIDVIINLNFDELLDNAIEDEMGSTEYLFIYNEATSLKFTDAFIDNRLIKPIYIKPHGTVSDIRSMKYTIEHYLGLSSEIKKCLSSILEGNITSDLFNAEERVGKINVISVGYSFSDLDIVSLITKKIKKDLIEGFGKTNFYIFERNEINQRTSEKLDQKLNSKGLNSRNLYTIRSININHDVNSDENINNLFVKLYYSIESLFWEPFKPISILRHQLKCKIFNQQFISNAYLNFNSGGITEDKIFKFLEKRYHFELLFEYLRFNGRIPKNVILGDRVGKYYQLVKRSALNSNRNLSRIYSPIADTYFKENCVITEDQYFFTDKEFYDYSFAKISDIEFMKRKIIQFKKAMGILNNKLTTLDIVYYTTKDGIGKSVKHDSLEKCSSDINDLFNRIIYLPSYEINSRFMDSKFNNLLPFKDSHFIPTNLSLTWKFFDFAVLKNNYNHIDSITVSGNSITNLAKYASNEQHLKLLFDRGVSMNVLLSVDIKDSYNVDNNNRVKNNLEYFLESGFKQTNTYNEIPEPQSVYFHRVNDEIKHHQMIIFSQLDRRKNVKVPVHAIYFFKPPNKNRINPIWFSVDEDIDYLKQNENNLKIILEFFDKLITKSLT